MYNRGKVKQPLISFSLGSKFSNSNRQNTDSYMTFGGVNHSQYIGELTKFDIDEDQWWAPSLNGLVYND